MESNKYIVVVEIDGTGYISKAFDHQSKASILFGILLATFANHFFANSRSCIPKYLRESNFKEYKINGNIKILSKSIRSRSDGKDSLHIFEINPDTFCFQTFAKERANYSLVFDYREMNKKIFSKQSHSYLIAN